MKRSVVLLFVLLVASWGWAATIHVPEDYLTIQAGIDAAQAGDVVSVAPGTYHDCTHTAGSATLHCVIMKSGVVLVSEAGPQATIIDAQDLGRVMLANNLNRWTVIEGFTIRGGKTGTSYGSGLRVENSYVTITDCVITDNRSTSGNGGGIYIYRGINVFSDCVISSNHANSWYGGGLYCITSSSSFDNCWFEENTARYGGAIVCDFGEHPTFTGCVIARNTASSNGGGIWTSNNSQPVFNNCTVVENSAASGSSFYGISGSNATFHCCIFAFGYGSAITCTGNSSFRCCDIYGNIGGDGLCGVDAGGNFYLDPQFFYIPGHNYYLNPTSPCLPGHHPTGCNDELIGALPADPSPVERHSWGSIKAMYR